MQTCVSEQGIACVKQPKPGGSSVVSSLVIEPTWLGNVYDGQYLATDKEMATLLSLAKGDSPKYCIR